MQAKATMVQSGGNAGFSGQAGGKPLPPESACLDDHFFDEDEVLDYVWYEEMRKEDEGGGPDKGGCLALLGFLVLPVAGAGYCLLLGMGEKPSPSGEGFSGPEGLNIILTDLIRRFIVRYALPCLEPPKPPPSGGGEFTSYSVTRNSFPE